MTCREKERTIQIAKKSLSSLRTHMCHVAIVSALN